MKPRGAMHVHVCRNEVIIERYRSSCKQFLISYTQALSQPSEDGVTIPVMSVCLA